MEQEDLVSAEEQLKENLLQFVFLVFIPNSHTGYVEIYLDSGDYRTVLSIKDLVSKIEEICGYEESNKIAVACNNLGIPFIYDRQTKTITQLNEKPKPDALSVSKIKKIEADKNKPGNYSINSIFNDMKKRNYQNVNRFFKG